MSDAFIVDALRTPIGRHGGALATVRPDDLAAHVLRSLMARHPHLDPALVEEVYFGAANTAGEDNRNVARMATLLAGLPISIAGATVNRLCGSGMEAVIAAARTVMTGDADVCLAGGVESMTRAPWVVLKPAKGYTTSNEQMWNTSLGWRMTNPKMPSEWTVSNGEATEQLADKFHVGREAQDVFAANSHAKAHAAWTAGHFDAESAPYPGVDLTRDECIRPDSSPASSCFRCFTRVWMVRKLVSIPPSQRSVT